MAKRAPGFRLFSQSLAEPPNQIPWTDPSPLDFRNFPRLILAVHVACGGGAGQTGLRVADVDSKPAQDAFRTRTPSVCDTTFRGQRQPFALLRSSPPAPITHVSAGAIVARDAGIGRLIEPAMPPPSPFNKTRTACLGTTRDWRTTAFSAWRPTRWRSGVFC